MATINKFGQYVLLTVHGATGSVVFQTDSLRVDFEVLDIPGFSRGKVEIYNLEPDTIRKISNGECSLTIDVRLHDGELQRVMDNMFISNTLDVVQVPNNITSLYCYSSVQKGFLQKQIDIGINFPSVRRLMEEVTKAAGFTGTLEFKHFPADYLDFQPPKNFSNQSGSLSQCIERISKEYGFKVYTQGDAIVCMYVPDVKNVASTELGTSKGDIILDSNNMRQNPKIGPAHLVVVSNLDPNIKTATILNVTELITMGADVSVPTLKLADDILKQSIGGFATYQTLTVKHEGSNYTGSWATTAMASTPRKGTSMATGDRWWIK